MDDFTKAYIVCALWASTNDDGEPLDDYFDPDDLHPDALKEIIDDCTHFQKAYAEGLSHCGTNEQNGHDYWLTRNGHGAGFWDRGYGTWGDIVSEFARQEGSSDLYVGDDGCLYVA